MSRIGHSAVHHAHLTTVVSPTADPTHRLTSGPRISSTNTSAKLVTTQRIRVSAISRFFRNPRVSFRS